MTDIARARPGGIAVFVAVAFSVTWAIWTPLLVQAQATGLDRMPWTFFLASVGPLCGAVAASAWEDGPRGVAAWARRIFSLRFRRVWWLAGIGMPLAYLVIAWLVTFVVTG
ncbi:hypothetical protein, partial [Streptomyces brasiliscabiei]|uniref:hypothetical protein n=1 Tax=Streptomyces brasiliscabiei TaxID=2736302 RepID=UPI0030151C59